MTDERKQAFINIMEEIGTAIADTAVNDVKKDCFNTEIYEMIDLYCFILEVLNRLMKNESRCKDETIRISESDK